MAQFDSFIYQFFHSFVYPVCLVYIVHGFWENPVIGIEWLGGRDDGMVRFFPCLDRRRPARLVAARLDDEVPALVSRDQAVVNVVLRYRAI